MIREKSGDILKARTEALVNPVNTRGVLGAGLARQFKLAYPTMADSYTTQCRRGPTFEPRQKPSCSRKETGMTTTEPRDTSGGHVLRVRLQHEYVSLNVECHEPNGAQCRVTCAAGTCETYTYPNHEHGLKSTIDCNAVTFFDNSDIECACATSEAFALYDGMPIEVEWDGDQYAWYPVAANTKG